MQDENQLPEGIGAGTASIYVCQIILHSLLIKGIIEPKAVRELIDGAILACEQLSSHPGQEFLQLDARRQLENLLVALETTSPPMIVSRILKGSGD